MSTPELGDFGGEALFGEFKYSKTQEGSEQCQSGQLGNDSWKFCQEDRTLWGTMTVITRLPYLSSFSRESQSGYQWLTEPRTVSRLPIYSEWNFRRVGELTLEPTIYTIRRLWLPGVNIIKFSDDWEHYFHVEENPLNADSGLDCYPVWSFFEYCYIGVGEGVLFRPNGEHNLLVDMATYSRYEEETDHLGFRVFCAPEDFVDTKTELQQFYGQGPWLDSELKVSVGDWDFFDVCSEEVKDEIRNSDTMIIDLVNRPTATPTPTAVPTPAIRSSDVFLPMVNR